ncbi:hypothetical protein MXMO3_00001 [Maritalea myrionectae]|uniref:Uncharacterized protein n=1 Tax=Maritalea myrionectae TaxID=454601 RepID=A0A2R4M954_9HYPH|nr:hypothetical protein MXMO3_00001 [Maritalea myrionectae]
MIDPVGATMQGEWCARNLQGSLTANFGMAHGQMHIIGGFVGKEGPGDGVKPLKPNVASVRDIGQAFICNRGQLHHFGVRVRRGTIMPVCDKVTQHIVNQIAAFGKIWRGAQRIKRL